jgi:nitrite reductase/ring-hydroxylating ferredoxin subunit/alkylhydroperoxidase/carboxymuconolactone decarboxylase family protein YurZ
MGKARGESRGLDYLKKARPQAVEHLLKFFGESGKHLDPKTRFLISVVTKVINFSPRGLDQYVRRALESGARPDEVIDAVLCSYPCAGLTRVVDAIDTILDMGLPGFEELAAAPAASSAQPAAESSDPAHGESRTSRAADSPPDRESSAAGSWVAVADAGEVLAGGALHVVAGNRSIALFNIDGVFRAMDNDCPHRGGHLSRGQVSTSPSAPGAAVVTCPLHAWKFDALTGESVNHPGARVRTYSVRVSPESRVEVFLPA